MAALRKGLAMGDIGRKIRTIEFEPMPEDVPVPEIVPAQPAPARSPEREPVKVPA